MSIDISFPDEPPEDPMDGDYLTFQAYVDGKPIKCVITFGALLVSGNDSEKIKATFASKKEQIHATAKSLIDDGEIENGEVFIDRLD